MGCNISKEATAVVSPLHSPAAAQNTLPKQGIETPYVQEEKQEDPSIKQPINQSIAPIITSTQSQPPVSSSEPNTPDPVSDAPAKPAKHHKHRREPSTATSSKHNSPALLAVQAPRISTSLSISPPGHTRKLSGHHRDRSQSVADALPGPSGNQLDTSKDQGMANQMKTRLAAEDTEKPARSRSAIETDNRGPDEPEASGDKHKKHREHKDKDKDKDKGNKEPKERKKKEKLIKTLELADLQHLSSTNLEALWKQYDKDKNGTLDRKELKRLAKDCIGRTIAMCENEIRLQQPKLSDQELKAAVEKELKFVLPGAAKENGKKEDVQKEMVRRLIRKLDVNGDGDVTKAELLATWNVFAKELFVMKAAEGPVGCSIM